MTLRRLIPISRPKSSMKEDEEMRLETMKTTYCNAIDGGDTNVYLLEGRALMKMAGDDSTVDTCHHNDLGFRSMVEELGVVMKKYYINIV